MRELEKEIKFYDLDGRLYEKWTYSYDDKGNVTEERIYDSYGRLLSEKTYKYKYDNNRNWVKKSVYIDKKLFETIERTIEYNK